MNPKQRRPIPEKIKKQLLLYTRYECCLCDSKISGKRERNIHHINGDPSDNRIENLIPLCPNCHARADRGDYPEEHLRNIREAKIRKIGIRAAFERVEEPKIAFKTFFTSKLDECIDLIQKGTYDHRLDDLIDELIMLIKERIETWDVPSVRFSTKELFLKFYRYAGKRGLCELYVMYRDLFKYAYSQRKHILVVMIQALYFILFESQVHEYNVERAEKASEVLLRLSIDFLNQDLEVTSNCFSCIDNIAGDMFEPEILSKEIILGAYVHKEKSRSPVVKDLLNQISENIQVNDQYAWEAEDYTYLIDSLHYAEFEQTEYSINIEPFKKQYLLPAVGINIDTQVQEFADFLAGSEFEGRENLSSHTSFTIELLARIILSYEGLRPTISEEIEQKVKETSNSYVIKEFNRIIDNSNLLKKIYRGSGMITTFNELIEFLENSSDMENLGVGVTTFSLAMIDFTRRLDEEAKGTLIEILKKYGIQEEFEVTDRGIQFEMDRLVYLGNNKNDMRKLIKFLKEINGKFRVKSFSTGITFELREIGKKSKS